MTKRLTLLAPSRLAHSLSAPCITNLILLTLLVASHAHAQVSPITQSGLNTRVSDPITVGGTTQFNITGGTRPGGGTNLFHSFGEFGVPTNNIANFLNETALPTDNILGRVTGGNSSNIFGAIQTTGFGGANLFLMNPAGFLFGPNATLNVGGAVTFTTANYLRLVDNARFNAIPNAAVDTLLTASPVAAFGFLGSNPGAITVQGSQITVSEGTGISLAGGNISIESGTPEGGTAQPARLSAPNGKIQLASAASPGEFDAATLQPLPNLNGASFTSFGTITLVSESTVDVSGTHAVSIRSSQFVLSVNDAVLTTSESAGPSDTIALSRGSSIVTSNAGADPGGDVAITTGNFQMDGASLKSTTTGEGRGGDVSITAESISLVNGAQIVSATEGPGTGGAVTLTATENVSISGFDIEGTLIGIVDDVGFVRSGVFTTSSSSGPGGAIVASAPAVMLTEGGTIVSTVSGEGHGGNITVNADALTLSSGSQIVSSSGIYDFATEEILGSGPGGNIAITATDSALVTGVSPDLFSLSAISASTSTVGKGGDITISAPNVTVEGSGAIVSSSVGEGAGGILNITAPDTLLVAGFTPDFPNSAIVSNASSSGAGGAITIETSSLVVNNRGVMQADSRGSGNGGALTVTALSISLTSGGGIETSGGLGASGKITLASEDTLLVSGQFIDLSGPLPDVIRSRIVNRATNGPGSNGGIDIVAREVVIEGGRLESQTGPGGGGDMSIIASDAIIISGGLNIQASTLGGAVGALSFSAPAITLLNQATVTSSTASDMSAGAMQFTTDTLTLRDGSIIRSNTEQDTGRGGAIVVDAENSVFLSGGSSIQSNTTTSQGGHAGSIMVQANNLISLSGSETGVFSESGNSTSLGTGNGGTISLQSSQVGITDGAVISAKSNGSGAAGSVTIEGTASPAQSIRIEGAGSGLFTETQGTGAGGNITARANEVRITDGAMISSKTTGAGNAGDILVKTNDLRMTGGATITAASTGPGNAGTVTIQGINSLANSVLIEGAGTGLFTNTEDQGRGGDVSIDTRTLTMQNGGTFSAATSGTDALATGGNINITASQAVDLRSNASISASSTGPADAGNISINAGNRFDARNSSVTTKSQQAGGGNIEINALDQIRLVNSQVNASAFMNGGNVSIDPNLVILQNSSILAQAIQGNGGNITIFTPLFLADSSSLVSASSQFGLNGTITIQSPTSNLSGSLGTLATKPRQAQNLLTQRCAALANGQASSFVVAGREQLPADPGGWLTSPLAFAGLESDRFDNGAVASAPMALTIQDTETVSLRRITPPGFLIAHFAESEATGCRS